MNLNEILDSLSISEQIGHVVSTEESIILYNSLLILQNENHFKKIFFWGRIFGLDNDYYVVYGYRNDILKDQVFYYSLDCINWGLLPLSKENARKLAAICNARFQGDPAFVLDVLIEKDETVFGDPLPEACVRKLKEEDRLSATVHMINDEAAVCPRGGLYRREDNVIVENATFQGLTLLEAREIRNFLHFRPSQRKCNSNLLTRDDYNFGIDFLDPLDIDIPENCWLTKFTADEDMVVLKTLFWPGMNFYHVLGTARYGFVYFGNGLKCMDVPFLLNNLQPISDDAEVNCLF